MTMQTSAQYQLRQYIEQLERLDEERKAIVADMKDKFIEAKANGFDVKIMRKVLAMRKQPKAEREEEETVLDVYLHALGMAGTPLAERADRVEVIGRAHGMPKDVIGSAQVEGV